MATKNFAILSGATGISSSIKSAISEENPLGYADNLTEQRAVDLLSNQEFLNDAALHYYEQDGTRFNTNEELIEAFMSDRRFGNLNSIGVAIDVYDAYTTNITTGQRAARLQRVYEALPAFTDGIGGFFEVVKNVVLDPVNLIGFGSAKLAATAAGYAAKVAGKTAAEASRAGLKAGIRKGAYTEAGINTVIEGGFDAALQSRDIELGIQDEYSPARGAISALAGGALGGVLGGAFGALGSRGKGREGFDLATTVESRAADTSKTTPAVELTEVELLAVARVQKLYNSENASKLAAVARAADDGTGSESGGFPTLETPEHKRLERRVRALRELADWLKNGPILKARYEALQAKGDTKSLDKADDLIREYEQKEALFERAQQEDLTPEQSDVLAVEVGDEWAEIKLIEYSGASPSPSVKANVQYPDKPADTTTTTGESPGTVGGGEPPVSAVGVSDPAQQFRITPEQVEKIKDAGVLRNEYERLANTLSNDEASIDADNAIKSQLEVLSARYEAIEGRSIAEDQASGDVDFLNPDLDDIPTSSEPATATILETKADLPDTRTGIQSEIDAIATEVSAINVKKKAAKKAGDTVKMAALAAQARPLNARRRKLREGLNPTTPSTVTVAATPTSRVVTASGDNTVEEVLGSVWANSSSNIAEYLNDLEPKLYKKGDVIKAINAAYKVALEVKGEALNQGDRRVVRIDYLRREYTDFKARKFIEPWMTGDTTSYLHRDDIAVRIEVQGLEQSDDLVAAAHQAHIKRVEEAANFILRDYLGLNKGDRTLALADVAEDYGQSTRDIVDRMTTPSKDELDLAEAEIGADISRQEPPKKADGTPLTEAEQKKLQKKLAAENRANLERAEKEVDKSITTPMKYAVYKAIKKNNPNASEEEIELQAAKIFLRMIDRQNAAADRELATGMKASFVANHKSTASAADVRTAKIYDGVVSQYSAEEIQAKLEIANANWKRIKRKFNRTEPGTTLYEDLVDQLEDAKQNILLAREGRWDSTGHVWERGLGTVNVVKGKKGATVNHGAGTIRAIGKLAAMFQKSNDAGFIGQLNDVIKGGRPLDSEGRPLFNVDGSKVARTTESVLALDALSRSHLARLSEKTLGIAQREIDAAKKLLQPQGGAEKVIKRVEAMIARLKKQGKSRTEIFTIVDKQLASYKLSLDQRFAIQLNAAKDQSEVGRSAKKKKHAARTKKKIEEIGKSVDARSRKSPEEAQEYIDELIDWHGRKYSSRQVKGLRTEQDRTGAVARASKAHKKFKNDRWKAYNAARMAEDASHFDNIGHEIGVVEAAGAMADDDWSRGLVDLSEDVMGGEFPTRMVEDIVEDAGTFNRAITTEKRRKDRNDWAYRDYQDHGDVQLYKDQVLANNEAAKRANEPPIVGDEQKPANTVHSPQVTVYNGIEVDLANDFRVARAGKVGDVSTYHLTVLGRSGAGIIKSYSNGSYSIAFTDSDIGLEELFYASRTLMKEDWPRIYSDDIRAASEAGTLSSFSHGGEGSAFPVNWRSTERYGESEPIPTDTIVVEPVEVPETKATGPEWKRTKSLDTPGSILVKKKDYVLAVQMRDAPEAVVRVHSRTQSQTAGDILGTEGIKQAYTIGMVPSRLIGQTGSRAAKAEFIPLFKGDPVVRPDGADVAPDAVAENLAATATPGPIPVDTLHTYEVNPDVVEKILSKKWREDANLNNLEDIHTRILDLEAKETKKIKNIDRHIKTLEKLYELISHPDHAPNGISLRNSGRVSSFADLRKIIDGRPAEDAVAMLQLLDRLAIEPGTSSYPVFRDAVEIDGKLTPYTTTAKAPRTLEGKDFDSNEIGLLSKRVAAGGESLSKADIAHNKIADQATGIFTMTHEVAHWGYINILTPKERLTFWGIMRDTYGREDGTLDIDAMNRDLPGYSPNQALSPNELFANQFAQWATSTGRTGTPPDRLASIWQRFASAAVEMIRRFVFKEEVDIDPRLIELFDRILPDAEANNQRYNVLLEEAKGAPKAMTAAKQLIALDEMRGRISSTINGDSLSDKLAALDDISRSIYFKFGGKAGTKTHGKGGMMSLRGPGLKRSQLLDGHGAKFGRGVIGKSARKARATLLKAVRGTRRLLEAVGGTTELREGKEFDTENLSKYLASDKYTKAQAEEIRKIAQDSLDQTMEERGAIPDIDNATIESYTKGLQPFSADESGALGSHWGLVVERVQEGLSPDAYAEMAGLDMGLIRLDMAIYNAQIEFHAMYRRNMKKAARKADPGAEKPGVHWRETQGVGYRGSNRAKTAEAHAKREEALVRKELRTDTGVDPDPRGRNLRFKDLSLRDIEAELGTLTPKAEGGTRLTDGRAKALRTRLIELVRSEPELSDISLNDIPADLWRWAKPGRTGDAALNRRLQGELDTEFNPESPKDRLAAALLTKRQIYRMFQLRGVPPRNIETSLVGRALRIEAQDNVGTPRVNGIPASATSSMEELLLRGTHRDPDIENTTRTLLYRLLNLQGKAGRNAINNATFVDLESLYRITGEPVPDGALGGTLDMGDPVVNAAVKKIRRFAVGLHKDRGDPLVLMHEIGEMVFTNFSERDVANITTSFEEALKKGDRLAKKIVEKYAGKESTLAEALQGATALTRRGFLKGAAAATIRGVPFTKLGPVQQALVKAKEVGVDFTRVFSFRDKLMGVVDPKFGSFVPTRRYVTDANALRDDGSSAQLDYGNTPLRVDDADTELAFDTGDDAIFTGKGLDEDNHELTAAFGDALNTMDRDVPVEVARENAHRTYWGNPSNEEAAAIRNVYAAIKKQFGGIRDFLDGSDNLLKTVNEFSTSAFEHLDVSLGKKIDVKLSAKQVKKAIEKAKADGTYVEPPTIEQLSKEWFVEGWAQYLGERVARGDIFKVRQGAKPLVLKGTLEILIDRLVEFAAYAVNGLIGRRTIRQQYRELTYFGDMFSNNRKARSQVDAVSSSGEAAVPPTMAASYATQVATGMDPVRGHRARRFIGIGQEESLDGHILFNSDLSIPQRLDPDAAPKLLEADAPFGEGVYLIQARDVNGLFKDAYEQETIAAMVDAATTNPKRRDLGHAIAQDIADNAKVIERIQRDIAQAEYRKLSPEPVEQGLPGGEAADDVLYAKQQQLARLTAMDTQLWDALADQADVTSSPRVAPVFVRAMNTLDLSDKANYTMVTGMNSINILVDGIQRAGLISSEARVRLTQQLPYHFTGRDFYTHMTTRAMIGDGYASSEVDARALLGEYLHDSGYDSIRATNNDATYLVVFDESNVMHVNSKRLDKEDGFAMPPNNEGNLLAEFVANGGLIDTRNFGATAARVQAMGVPKSVTHFMRKVYRGEAVTSADMEAVHKFGNIFNFRKNSDHLRRGGGHWFAEIVQPENGTGFYEEHGSEVGRQLGGLIQGLQSLPDAGNMVSRWIKRSDWRKADKKTQPPSHIKIVEWLRGDDAVYNRFSTEEREVAEAINEQLQEELTVSQKAGIVIGDIRNRGIKRYFPQVADVEEMSGRLNDYVDDFTEWFTYDAKMHGRPITRADAISKAERLYRKTVDDNGLVEASGIRASDASMRRAILIDWNDLAKNNPSLAGRLKRYYVNDLTGTLFKYFDSSVRRRLLAKSMGEGDHAFNSYISIAMGGRQAALGIFTKGRRVGKPEYVNGDVRWRTEGRIIVEHDVFDRIATTEEAAGGLYDQMVAILTVDGNTASGRHANKEAAKNFLLNSYKDPSAYNTNIQFKARVDAIVGAMADFGGEGGRLTTSGAKFMEATMDTLHRKRPANFASFSGEWEQNVARTIRAFNSVTLLGFTTLTSIPDVALPLILSGNIVAFTKAWAKYTSLDPAYRRASQRIGISIENLISDRMSNMHDSYGGRFQNAFFNGTLLSPWTNINREIAAIVGHEALLAEALRAQQLINRGQMNSVAYRKTQRFLKRYGVEKYGQPGGPSMEADLVKIADDDGGTHDSLRFGIHRFVNEAIYTPNPNDVPMWAQTPWGSLIFQLKSFPLMMQRMAGYIWDEGKHGNLNPFLAAITAGAGFGALSLGIKDLVQQRADGDGNFRHRSVTRLVEGIGFGEGFIPDSKTVDEAWGWYIESILAAGGLGLFAELLYNTAAYADNGAFGKARMLSYIFGPTVGLAHDSLGVVQGAGAALRGDTANYSKRAAYRTVASRVPVAGGFRPFREEVANLGGDAPSTGGNRQSSKFGKGFGSKGFSGGF